MKRDVRDAMKQWATWRRGRTSAGLFWPKSTMLGRVLDGMKTVRCKCRGSNQDCELCYGTGKVKLNKEDGKINPAFLPSHHGQPDDIQSQTIDRLMCELAMHAKTKKLFRVLWAEYVRGLGTQEVKAQRLRLEHGHYRKLLHLGHEAIEIGLQNVTKMSA